MNAVVAGAHAHVDPNRIGVALLFSLMLHGIVILGVGFHFAKPAPSLPTLDVTLINTSNAEAPNKLGVMLRDWASAFVTRPRVASSTNAMSMVCIPSFWLACMMTGI